MNRAYWEGVAADYEESVMSVYDLDAGGEVCRRIAAAGAAYPGGRAADLGCGVGKFTPTLAAEFAAVEACDLAASGLAAARIACRDCSNVTFRQLDLTADALPYPPVDFVLCVNVLLMPSLDERRRAWRAVTNQVAAGGRLLLVLPSLEAVQLERFRDLEARLDLGDSCVEALAQSLPAETAALDLHQGVHRLDGLRTKHYLREEVSEMLAEHAFKVEEITRLEYRPSATGALLETWDWLAVARRRA